MAATVSNLHARVARLLSRQHGKPVLKPNKPLALADKVANRKERLGEASCITEMSLMMACWKQNDFSDAACASEIKAFFVCSAKAEAERKAKASQNGVDRQTGTLPPKQVIKLLQRFPNLRYEI